MSSVSLVDLMQDEKSTKLLSINDENDGDDAGEYNAKYLTLVNPRNGRSNVNRLESTHRIRAIYLKDPFHTLIGSPWWRIFVLFLIVYMMSLATFALIYLHLPCEKMPKSFNQVCYSGGDDDGDGDDNGNVFTSRHSCSARRRR